MSGFGWQVTKAVAEHLKVEADKLRFTSVDSFTKKVCKLISLQLRLRIDTKQTKKNTQLNFAAV
jgi:hypothetical protein